MTFLTSVYIYIYLPESSSRRGANICQCPLAGVSCSICPPPDPLPAFFWEGLTCVGMVVVVNAMDGESSLRDCPSVAYITQGGSESAENPKI